MSRSGQIYYLLNQSFFHIRFRFRCIVQMLSNRKVVTHKIHYYLLNVPWTTNTLAHFFSRFTPGRRPVLVRAPKIMRLKYTISYLFISDWAPNAGLAPILCGVSPKNRDFRGEIAHNWGRPKPTAQSRVEQVSAVGLALTGFRDVFSLSARW